MDKRLQRLETMPMRGDDGQPYKVCAYEHLALLQVGPEERWESTGQIEYQLDGGGRVDVDAAGRMTVAGNGVALTAAKP